MRIRKNHWAVIEIELFNRFAQAAVPDMKNVAYRIVRLSIFPLPRVPRLQGCSSSGRDDVKCKVASADCLGTSQTIGKQTARL